MYNPLVDLGFTHHVIVNSDRSVRSRGATEAIFRCESDAKIFADRLNVIYSNPDAYKVETI